MFDLYCPTCDCTYLVGPRSLRALVNTGDGPVGVATCLEGHVSEVAFRPPDRRAPAPDQSVADPTTDPTTAAPGPEETLAV